MTRLWTRGDFIGVTKTQEISTSLTTEALKYNRRRPPHPQSVTTRSGNVALRRPSTPTHLNPIHSFRRGKTDWAFMPV